MSKKKNEITTLTGRQTEHLLWGWCLTNMFPFDSDEARREAWFANKEYLLSLEGIERIPGVFGAFPLKKGEKPQAMKDYEGKKRKAKSD